MEAVAQAVDAAAAPSNRRNAPPAATSRRVSFQGYLRPTVTKERMPRNREHCCRPNARTAPATLPVNYENSKFGLRRRPGSGHSGKRKRKQRGTAKRQETAWSTEAEGFSICACHPPGGAAVALVRASSLRQCLHGGHALDPKRRYTSRSVHLKRARLKTSRIILNQGKPSHRYFIHLYSGGSPRGL